MLSSGDNAILGLAPRQGTEFQERRRRRADLRDSACAEHLKGARETLLVIAAQRRPPIEELKAELERGLVRSDGEDIYIIATECERQGGASGERARQRRALIPCPLLELIGGTSACATTALLCRTPLTALSISAHRGETHPTACAAAR